MFLNSRHWTSIPYSFMFKGLSVIYIHNMCVDI